MTEELLPPDEQMLRLHLESGRFRSGVARGWWRLIALNWPYVTIAITARGEIEYVFRFHCANYPHTPVTGGPWDLEANNRLPADKWPKGNGRFSLAFNPNWKNGTCLYLPCDRQSIEGHNNWRHEHPALLWEPEKGICKYLTIIHELLNSSDYRGSRAA